MPISVKTQRICYRKVLSRSSPRSTRLKAAGLWKVGSEESSFTPVSTTSKKNKRFNESVDLIHATSIQVREETIPSIIQAKEVVECIRILPIGYRTVLNLYAIEGFSHKEISSMLDIEESTSRSQYTRAKAMLEDILVSKHILYKPKEEMLVAASGR